MKGYKGFNPGLECRGKQYAENTVFEEDGAEICKKGMHFCENPFDVLDHYGFVSNVEVNDFAEVEALADTKTDDGRKFCTSKLKVGAKIGIPGLVNAFVEYTKKSVDFENAAATNTGDCSAATNTGNYSAATNTGDCSAATNTGFCSAATNTGDRSAATKTGDCSAASVEGKEGFAIATGIKSKAKAALGCYIAVAEWTEVNGVWVLKDFKTRKVDGKRIKENVYYTLENGKFVEAE